MNSAGLKRFLFFWCASFVAAVSGYYLLWLLMPGHQVFGSWYHMFLYHDAHPAQYLAIACFCYSCLASLLSARFRQQRRGGQVVLTLVIFAATILMSSPFGGMLWHYHDMQAGYFPEGWVSRMISLGFNWGLTMGWIITVLSFPYNLLAMVGCFFLTRKGAGLFRKADAPALRV